MSNIELQLELDFYNEIAQEINHIKSQIHDGRFYFDDWQALKEKILWAFKEQPYSAEILEVLYASTLRLLALHTELLMLATSHFEGK